MLQVEDGVPGEAVPLSPDSTTPHPTTEGTPADRELATLAARVAHAEEVLLMGGGAGSPSGQEGSPSAEAEASTQLATLADRLEPLEDVFRQLAEQLSTLNCSALEDTTDEEPLEGNVGAVVITAIRKEVSQTQQELTRTQQDLASLAQQVEHGFRCFKEADAELQEQLDRVWGKGADVVVPGGLGAERPTAGDAGGGAGGR